MGRKAGGRFGSGFGVNCGAMFIDGFASPEHMRKERLKARELRQTNWWRQRLGEGVCHHCRARLPKQDLTMDHLIPIARGGRTAKNNVVTSCRPCNASKGHALPVEQTFAELDRER